MENKIMIFGLLATFFSLALAQADDELRFEFAVDNDKPMVGDNVTFTCQAINLPFSSLIQMDRLAPQEGVPPLNIGRNGAIGDDIKNQERYSAALDDATLTFTTVITGVLNEDAGKFRCGDPGTSTFEELTLVVRIDPTEISLTLNAQEVDDGEEFEMEVGEKRDIVCTVSGSKPAPMVKVILENEAGEQTKDLTSKFEMITSLEILPVGKSTPRTFRKSAETTIATVTDLNITSEFSMKSVKCMGSIEGREVTVEKKFSVKLSGMPPVFECEKDYVSYIGDKDLTISCLVKAEPTLTESSVTWMYGLFKNYSRSVTNTQPTNGHYVYTQKKVQGENAWNLELFVEFVSQQMFRNYTFQAKNDFGMAEHVVILNRDETRDVIFGAAGFMKPTILLTIAMALTSLLAWK